MCIRDSDASNQHLAGNAHMHDHGAKAVICAAQAVSEGSTEIEEDPMHAQDSPGDREVSSTQRATRAEAAAAIKQHSTAHLSTQRGRRKPTGNARVNIDSADEVLARRAERTPSHDARGGKFCRVTSGDANESPLKHEETPSPCSHHVTVNWPFASHAAKSSPVPLANSAGARFAFAETSDHTERPATPPQADSNTHEQHLSPVPKQAAVDPSAKHEPHACGDATVSNRAESEAATISIARKGPMETTLGGDRSCADSAGAYVSRICKRQKELEEEAVAANAWLVKHLKTAPVRVKRCVLDALRACHSGEPLKDVSALLPPEWSGAVRQGVLVIIQKTAAVQPGARSA